MTPRLKVKPTRRKGRGVFANCRIKKGETIETAPVIVLSSREAALIAKSSVENYCYEWGPNSNRTALVLGLGCFYNHSYRPNAEYRYQFKRKAIVFFALKNIAKGEEITHNYNGSPSDQTPIRFLKNSWERM